MNLSYFIIFIVFSYFIVHTFYVLHFFLFLLIFVNYCGRSPLGALITEVI